MTHPGGKQPPLGQPIAHAAARRAYEEQLLSASPSRVPSRIRHGQHRSTGIVEEALAPLPVRAVPPQIDVHGRYSCRQAEIPAGLHAQRRR